MIARGDRESRVLLDGAGSRRDAALRALSQLGVAADAPAIVDSLERYIGRLQRRTGVRWRLIWIGHEGRRARLVAGPQATVHYRAARGRWEQKRLAAGTRALIDGRRERPRRRR